MKRSEIVEKEAVETDGRADRYRGANCVVLTRATGKMKSKASKKAYAVKGVIGLRDYCDLAKMVFSVPS